MDKAQIDHKVLIDELKAILGDASYDESHADDGRTFTLRTKSPLSVFTATITSKWVGYEYELEDFAKGYSVGYSSDTDLYPLGFDTKATYEIFEELSLLLKSLLEHKIFAGLKDGVPILARPLNEEEYELKIFHKTKWLRLEKTEVHIVKASDLKPLYSLAPVV